jgi:hypothetical protein
LLACSFTSKHEYALPLEQEFPSPLGSFYAYQEAMNIGAELAAYSVLQKLAKRLTPLAITSSLVA